MNDNFDHDQWEYEEMAGHYCGNSEDPPEGYESWAEWYYENGDEGCHEEDSYEQEYDDDEEHVDYSQIDEDTGFLMVLRGEMSYADFNRYIAIPRQQERRRKQKEESRRIKEEKRRKRQQQQQLQQQWQQQLQKQSNAQSKKPKPSSPPKEDTQEKLPVWLRLVQYLLIAELALAVLCLIF